MKKLTAFFMLVLSLAGIADGQEVKASSFEFSAEDATRCLQRALASGASRVVIDNVGVPYNVSQTVTLYSNQTVVFAKGVVVQAKKGAFEVETPMFRGDGVQKLTLVGEEGAAIRMNKDDYCNPKQYKPSEYRHAFVITASDDLVFRNLTIAGSGGDGIYFGGHKKLRPYSKNVLIENCVFDGHNRLGIAVISAENLTIRNCVFKNATGAPPQGGIDFEPNFEEERLVNCLVENCQIYDNRGSGISVTCGNLSVDSQPVSVTIRNCDIRSNGVFYIHNYNGTQRKTPAPAQGTILVDNCRIGDEVQMREIVKSIDLRFNQCQFTCKPAGDRGFFQILGESVGKYQLGGVFFNDCTINGVTDLTKLFSADYCGKSEFAQDAISGTLLCEVQGSTTACDLTKVTQELKAKFDHYNRYTFSREPALDKLVPPAQDAVKSPGGNLFIRGGIFLQYAEKGQKITMDVTTKRFGYDSAIAMSVMSPSNQLVMKTEILPDKQEKVEFIAPESGIYRVLSQSFNALSIKSLHRGNGWQMHRNTVSLLYPNGSLYFRVPEGVKAFAFAVNAMPDAEMQLARPDGKLALSRKIVNMEFIEVPDAVPGVWRINIRKCIWSVNFYMCEPLSGIVSITPETLFE
ncbi:MAG: right-handed parallel beta-helix repeat-containing protein [Lentisphaeria bacterium]|nr:right-handed parallel beta-helix repeat-containing protein [Lentisphaeria bacterium]